MTRAEFDQVMQVLVDEYDPVIEKLGGRRLNVYGPGRCTAIFESVKDRSQTQFSSIALRAFQSERQAPLAKDIMRIREEIRIELHEKTRRLEKSEASRSLENLSQEQKRKNSEAEEKARSAMQSCIDSLKARGMAIKGAV